MMMKMVWEARKKIIGIGAVVLLMLLMMNLNSRLNEYFRLTSERDRVGTQVSDLRATKVALQTQAAYATSDEAVEEWARSEAHLALPGDQVIVPLTPAGQTAAPSVEATPTPLAVQNWEVWWALFFGE
jgi:hypothetical protein